MQTASVAAVRHRSSSIGTRHRLEALAKLLSGESVEEKYAQHTIEDMLGVFKTTREGFDFLESDESQIVLFWSPRKAEAARHALHFEELFGGKGKAGRVARALEKTFEGYQTAAAAYDTPRFEFETDELQREVI